METRFDILSFTLGKETGMYHVENAFYQRVR